jgi:hypothetical protein
MSDLAQIRRYLEAVKPGKVPDEKLREVEGLLLKCWDRLSGSDAGGMTASKLIGRTEEMEWIPPALNFKIERHGALVNGSSRAEVQCWRVDLDRENAELVDTRRRQKLPTAKRLDVKPIAAEIAALINDGREDKRIKWRAASRARIVVSEVIPATNQQTTSSRRKRFAAEVERLLVPFGWKRKNAGSYLVFERSGSG